MLISTMAQDLEDGAQRNQSAGGIRVFASGGLGPLGDLQFYLRSDLLCICFLT